jgi:excisionase family DNA binding protein
MKRNLSPERVKQLEVLSRQEACTYLGVSMSTLERMIRAGELPIVKLDRRVLIRKAALDAVLQEREDPVLRRLRASKQRVQKTAYHAGEAAGRWWAEELAEVDELAALEQARDRAPQDWPRLFQQYAHDAYSVGERVAFLIRPHEDGNRQAAQDFWDELMPVEDRPAEKARDPDYVQGFATAALDLWARVKDRL